MLKSLIDDFEKLKRHIYIIERGIDNSLIIKFNDDNFYHLIGLQHLNIDMHFPSYMKSKQKIYSHIKKHVKKYDNIITNKMKGKETIIQRISTFHNIVKLFDDLSTQLYDIRRCNMDERVKDKSVFDGDYGLSNKFSVFFCLLGVKLDNNNKVNIYAPQSWMADKDKSRIIENKPAKAYRRIIIIGRDDLGEYLKNDKAIEENKKVTE